MEAVFGSVAAVMSSRCVWNQEVESQQQVILIKPIALNFGRQMLEVEKNVDDRLTKFDLETGTKMVRVVTPIAQATKSFKSCWSLNH